MSAASIAAIGVLASTLALLTGLVLVGVLGFSPAARERLVGSLSRFFFGVGALAGLVTLGAALGAQPAVVSLGTLFTFEPQPGVEVHSFALTLHVDSLSAVFTALTTVLLFVVAVFSDRYLHRERGHYRFFAQMALFAFGTELLTLAESIDLLFVGWEIVGITSALLIAFFLDRPEPVRHGLWAFVVYRIGDAGLLLAVAWIHHYADDGSLSLAHPAPAAAAVIGAGLLVAAMGKSAQLPFSSWLPRAMEGPTPSSALFYGALSIHAGAYLLLRTEPIWSAAPALRVVLVVVGLLTALHGTFVGRAQADVKCSLAYASMAQAGLVFAEIGMGWRVLALVHLIGHATVRTLQLLRAPSILHDRHVLESALGRRLAPTGRHLERLVPPGLQRRLYRFALHRWQLDALGIGVLGHFFGRVLRFADGLERRFVTILGGGEGAEAARGRIAAEPEAPEGRR